MKRNLRPYSHAAGRPRVVGSLSSHSGRVGCRTGLIPSDSSVFTGNPPYSISPYRQCSAIAAKATPPSTTHHLSVAVSRPYQQRGRRAVPPGSCTATRPRCHAHRLPAVIRGDAKKRPCHRRRREPEPSAPPAPLLGPRSSSRAPRWCRAARSRHRPQRQAAASEGFRFPTTRALTQP
jgi:hypothetical protein